jgi:hypothetical protein
MRRAVRPAIAQGTGMGSTDFHHEAFFYADADEFLAGAVPFLLDGLAAGEPALVAVTAPRAAALAAELGSSAEEVRFVEMEELGRNPARIIPAWQRFVEDRGGSDRPVRGIGEPVWPGRSADEVDECQRHESLLNHAFWDGPAWRLLCPYDSGTLDEEVLEVALESHAVTSGTWANPEKMADIALAPGSVSPFVGVLPARPPTAREFDFNRTVLHEARQFVAAEARERGLGADRVFELVAAIGELTANSVLHGGGRGVLSV